MSRRILLLSNSQSHGRGYLEHVEAVVMEFLAGCRHVVFVPYALKDWEGYTAKAQGVFTQWDLPLEGIHEWHDPVEGVHAADAIFIGGGNTFRLLDHLHRLELIAPIRARAAQGMPYMGSSAGSNVAGPDIKTTNDMPIVQPPSFAALALVPFNVNPHYLDASPDSKHMGETREQRIREFHEENDAPVVAIREGSLLRIEDSKVTLIGETGGRVFFKDRDPMDCPAGADLSYLFAGPRGRPG
jgi:dipeptidase E